jgi:hypothetical protein
VATQEEIEKYLKQLKKMQISLPGTLSAWKSAVIDIAPEETPVPTRFAQQAVKDSDTLFNLIYYPARNRR